ncbi:MAG: lipopolysaccharide heptosyltransferase II [Acidobacteria bacterium]|nr:MAG: lipopolysaccharide heptosyltransferase II [Acidobacteriota bacterium]
MASRFLVIAPNWLGDAVMALPALAAVRRARPEDTLVVAARAAIAPLFQMVAGVDEVVTLPAVGGSRVGVPWGALRSWRAEAGRLQEANAATALLLPNSFRSAWIVRRAGIPERWGVASDLRQRLLTRAVPRPKLPDRHHSEYYGAIVTALGFPVGEDRPLVAAPEAAVMRAAALLARDGVEPGSLLVGLAPGAAYGRAKQWPPRRYADLACELHARAGVTSVVVGSGGDKSAGDEIMERCRSNKEGSPRVVNLVGQTDLATLVAVMSRCRAFVSNDSGAMHLAAAAGLPVTAPFGPTRERETAPLPVADSGVPAHAILTAPAWCRPCMLRECPIDHRCMTRITVGAAVEALSRQIGR